MKQTINFTLPQKFVIIVLRLLIGWHLLYEGISKLLILTGPRQVFCMNPNGFLRDFPIGLSPMRVFCMLLTF